VKTVVEDWGGGVELSPSVVALRCPPKSQGRLLKLNDWRRVGYLQLLTAAPASHVLVKHWWLGSC